jgi:hypothetical protein
MSAAVECLAIQRVDGGVRIHRFVKRCTDGENAHASRACRANRRPGVDDGDDVQRIEPPNARELVQRATECARTRRHALDVVAAHRSRHGVLESRRAKDEFRLGARRARDDRDARLRLHALHERHGAAHQHHARGESLGERTHGAHHEQVGKCRIDESHVPQHGPHRRTHPQPTQLLVVVGQGVRDALGRKRAAQGIAARMPGVGEHSLPFEQHGINHVL